MLTSINWTGIIIQSRSTKCCISSRRCRNIWIICTISCLWRSSSGSANWLEIIFLPKWHNILLTKVMRKHIIRYISIIKQMLVHESENRRCEISNIIQLSDAMWVFKIHANSNPHPWLLSCCNHHGVKKMSIKLLLLPLSFPPFRV